MGSVSPPPISSPHVPSNLSSLFTPFKNDTLLQIRTGPVQRMPNLPIKSAIHKTRRRGAQFLSQVGLRGDEQAFHNHGGEERAIMHYCSSHYAMWKSELGAEFGWGKGEGATGEEFFDIGGFGENFISENMNERNVCIGDIISVGRWEEVDASQTTEGEECRTVKLWNGVKLQVTQARAPCYKLNHRFKIANMAYRAQMSARAGWFYRVLTTGVVREGDTIELVERINPEWSVARVQWFMYVDMANWDALREIVKLEGLGGETKGMLQKRLSQGVENQSGRLVGGETLVLKEGWQDVRLVSKTEEAQGVISFVFESPSCVEEECLPQSPIPPGSHIRIRLPNGLTRAYSIISGTPERFEIGVSLASNSRGGSEYLHSTSHVGDIFSASVPMTYFPLATGPSIHHHLLIAAGIGITALLPAAAQLQASSASYALHLAVRDASQLPFRRYLQDLRPHVTIYSKADSQRLSIPSLLGNVDKNTHIYVCGPQRLMDELISAARTYGLEESSVHFEAFTVDTEGDAFEVELEKSGKVLKVKEHMTLLSALREAGIVIDSQCEAGNCGTCVVGVKGRVDHRGVALLEEDKSGGKMLCCVSRGVGRIALEF